MAPTQAGWDGMVCGAACPGGVVGCDRLCRCLPRWDGDGVADAGCVGMVCGVGCSSGGDAYSGWVDLSWFMEANAYTLLLGRTMASIVLVGASLTPTQGALSAPTALIAFPHSFKQLNRSSAQAMTYAEHPSERCCNRSFRAWGHPMFCRFFFASASRLGRCSPA